MGPNFERLHPHGAQHTFNRSDQLPPATGTLRLYVDGTLGNDAASGTSWATAWKTCARLIQGISAIDFLLPGSMTGLAFLRGSFATEDLDALLWMQGTSRWHIGQHVNDFTTVRTAVVFAVTAATEKHSLARITLAAGHGLDGTELGMTIVFDDPVSGSRGCSTVVRVDTTTAAPLAYVWTTQQAAEFPAWVAGSPANVTIRAPSIQINEVHYEQRSTPAAGGFAPTSDVVWPVAWLIGIRANHIRVRGGRVGLMACYVRSAGGIWGGITADVGEQFLAGFWRYPLGGSKYLYLEDWIAQEYGITAGPTPIANALLGSAAATCSSGSGSIGAAFYGYLSGSVGGGFGRMACERSNVGGCDGSYGGISSVQSCILRGAVSATQLGEVYGRDLSWLDLPAAGLDAMAKASARGLVRFQDADLEGDNTGTAAARYGALVQTDGTIIFEAGLPSGFKAKTSRIRNEGGTIELGGASTFDSSFGAGPDIYVGPQAGLHFADNVTKSAVNSETAIQSGVDGQIVVGAPDTFVAASAVFTAAHVGRSIKVSVAANAGNIGVHEITSYVSPTTVGINNIAAPVAEAGMTWGLVGTPRPILEVARGGRVSQAAGKTFNVRKPEVEPAPGSGLQEWGKWGYGLAGTGFVHIHEGAEVVLGTIVEAAGAANAAGIAVRVKNESKLLHTGGAVILGTAPLDLGGSAAQAWPATIVSDAAAATPQGCRVIANV